MKGIAKMIGKFFKNSEFWDDYGDVILKISLGVFLLVIIVSVIPMVTKLNTYDEPAYLECLDKYTRSVPAGNSVIIKHYVKVNYDDTDFELLVDNDEYDGITIGDNILCTLFIHKTDHTIKTIEIGGTNLEVTGKKEK